MTKRAAILANTGVALLAVLVTLGLVELALRFAYPASDRHYVLEPNQVVTLTPQEEYVPGVSGPATYRTSSWGIRGPEFGPEDEYRILAIGGSTTQNGYLDQTETWTLLVGELLEAETGTPTWSGDVGRSGHTARSHVLQLQHVVPELPGIDAVVMLLGVNDLTVALRKGFTYEPEPPLSDPDARAQQMRQAFLRVPGRLHDRSTNYLDESVPGFKRLALYQLARLVRDGLRAMRGGTGQDLFGEVYATWRAHRAAAPVVHDSLPDLTEPLREYRGYLQEMAHRAAELDVRLVFLTQPTLWREGLTPAEEASLWLGGTGDFQNEPGHDYFAPAVLREAMDAYNRTLLAVCAERSVECVDVAAALPKDTDHFYDDVHFTERGSRLVAETVADYLRAHPPYAAPNASGARR